MILQYILKHLKDFLNGKIIEFNGDLWHANPMKYKETDVITMVNGNKESVKSIWEHDKKRKQAIESKGFHVHVVWEADYGNDPDGVVDACVKFLKGE